MGDPSSSTAGLLESGGAAEEADDEVSELARRAGGEIAPEGTIEPLRPIFNLFSHTVTTGSGEMAAEEAALLRPNRSLDGERDSEISVVQAAADARQPVAPPATAPMEMPLPGEIRAPSHWHYDTKGSINASGGATARRGRCEWSNSSRPSPRPWLCD